MSTTIADVLAALEKRYPSALAEVWDAVGLVTGNPHSKVDKVLFAVDPLQAVVNEAVEIGAQLIVAHHPLILLTEESPVPAPSKTKIMAALLAANIGLITVHTNADVAFPGVSDALALSIGVEVSGAIDDLVGLGRIGKLAKPMSLRDFATQVAQGLPKTNRKVHVAGNLDATVKSVAICGGAGASLLEQVSRTDVDVYVTSDLKYHLAQEFVENSGIALIDISHWAGEWLWLDQGAKLLAQDLGGTLKTQVSAINTDPWSMSI